MALDSLLIHAEVHMKAHQAVNCKEKRIEVDFSSIKQFLNTFLTLMAFQCFFYLEIIYAFSYQVILPKVISFFSSSENQIQRVNYAFLCLRIHVSIQSVIDCFLNFLLFFYELINLIENPELIGICLCSLAVKRMLSSTAFGRSLSLLLMQLT